ncbi:CPBP family glutamic-type intramembrane protease [Paracoccus sp. S1E-3]|uniref:CPBP family glutamic-type intramembrane protease n=1 Tax=Paracoccus sp. S1E-3 TaxID=2756130 RepID=UPI0015EEA7A5|nr:CPBP family intramembrane glutamic endopeptidase [Paracoccus sp. S1E-3]MBA4492382.1 CPBP family intramembrane metalloprotease [Paracoccus sp. S1E-3]
MVADIDRRSDWTRARGIYAELWAYLRRPYWMESRRPWDGMVLRQLFWLFLLDVALMVVSVLVVSGYTLVLTRLNLPLPGFSDDGMGDPRLLLISAVIIAPLAEEFLFRSWLKGTPRYLLVLAGLFLASFLSRIGEGPRAEMIQQWLLILAGIVAVLILWRGGRQPVPFFQRHFVWFFWLSSASFALVHWSNYDEGTSATVIPMLLPQFVAGVNWAFARMRFGLRASILLHAVANGILVVPMVLIA